jgi:hypothetical protein
MMATAATARRPKAMPADRSGEARKVLTAPGRPATMPAKMMKLMPLPMPRSVMSSPIHITSTVPAVRLMIWVSVVKLVRSKSWTTPFWGEESRAR